MKTLLSFLLVISFVVILGIGGYYLRGQQESTATPPQEEEGKLPAVQTQPSSGGANAGNAARQGQGTQTVQQLLNVQKLNTASQGPALDYFVDKGSGVYVVQPDGKVTKTIGGKSEVLSNGPVAGIISASFSPDGKRIAAAVGSDTSVNKIEIFDIGQKTWTLLPYIVQSMTWAPSGSQVAFLSPGAGGASSVFTLDIENQKAKPVEIIKIYQQDLSLNWISPSKILLSDAPNSGWSSPLWSLDVSKKTLSLLLADRPGLETVWSSSSPIFGLVFSAGAEGQGGKLSLVNESGKSLQLLNFLTLPSKCSFYNKAVSGQVPASQQVASTTATSSAVAKTVSATAPTQKTFSTMVCAVPRDRRALDLSALPDAYQQKEIFTSDDFFEVDVASGNTKNIFNDSNSNVDAENIKIFNQSVFFVNRYDQKVYSAQLPR